MSAPAGHRWDTPGTAALREAERRERQWWAAYVKAHPPPKRTATPGRWEVPAWTGPDSPQTSVWLEQLRRATERVPRVITCLSFHEIGRHGGAR